MSKTRRTSCPIVVLLPLIFSMVTVGMTANAQELFIRIGAGSDPGVYYAAGAAICGEVTALKGTVKVKCYVASSGGSVLNIEALRRGETEFAIVQSDVHSLALDGKEAFAKRKPFAELKTLFSLHSEPFTLVARKDSGIRGLEDLKGKRVNVGNPGSGQRQTFERLLLALGWSMDDFKLAAELKPSEQSAALCKGEIDAMVFVVGHPNKSVKAAADGCDVVLVNVAGPEVDKLVKSDPSYGSVKIPGGLYRGNSKEVSTFGVRAVVVSTARTPQNLVYTVVGAVFDDLKAFKGRDPGLASLQAKDMVENGLKAPLHEGAMRYYKENSLK